MKGKDSTQTNVQEQETKEENKQDEATAPRKLDSKEENVTRAQNIDWITPRKTFSQKHPNEVEKLSDAGRNSVNSFMTLGGDEGVDFILRVHLLAEVVYSLTNTVALMSELVDKVNTMEGIINEGHNGVQQEATMTPGEATKVINVDEGGPSAEIAKEKTEEELDVLRRTFLDNMTLDLEPDFELNAEVTRTGVLASFFEGNGVSRTRLKEILEQIWKLTGHWRFKTLKLGIWGIFFDKEEDCVTILNNRPWLINGKLLIVHERPEYGSWNTVDLTKAVFWVKATGLPTPYLNRSNIPTIAAKAGEYKGCDTSIPYHQREVTPSATPLFDWYVD
ncbi:hypothetical protein F8388_021933 [Cannabis sativa]|uniref:DUF4283 domain-containing protein n=1 Tax=Cannabis sativa TaxID=3483 RepID=A0A7J6EH27_CANSA|nr:hypothetical protein F8388_021933 [Cannabis sativa]